VRIIVGFPAGGGSDISGLQLIEQGRFSLDDPVEKYLPEFADLKVFEWFDPAAGG
jgi:CubicO group peptidase (beta-lactamase class C family)